MSDPIQWPNSNLEWTPDGYCLSLVVWLDQRASALFERLIEAALTELDSLAEEDFELEFTGGARWKTATGAESKPAQLTIIAPRTLFAVDPEALGRTLRALAARCQEEADEQHERDEQIASDWLKRLRSL